MDVLLGFDPGGRRQFGWAALELTLDLPLRVRATGVSDDAAQAVAAALERVEPGERLRAAGIDAPLFWTPSGERGADLRVRAILRARGAGSTAGGTVQHPNCLQGACVVQGPTAALLLRRHDAELPLTESHPKALLWALGLATPARRPNAVGTADIGDLARGRIGASEHERDAVLGGYAAWAMVTGADGWEDLVLGERDPLFFTRAPVGYWFPRLAG